VQANPREELNRRMVMAAAVLCAVLFVGGTGYFVLGDGRWQWTECLYMTVITLSTVGFGETLPGFDHVAYARLWTVVLIVLGSGTLLYFVSTFTAFFIEGDIQGALRRNRMKKRIDELRDHVIVVGAGTTGTHIIEELVATKTPFVVVDESEERLARISEEIAADALFVQGDATDDNVLEEAGIKRARGLAAALREDKDNVFLTITARALNPELRIVARVTENSSQTKLDRAGADATVSPSFIGGMRIVSQLIRPRVVQFLDQMLYDREQSQRIEEVSIPESSGLCGAKLKETNIRHHTDVLVLAVRHPDGKFSYNPGPDFVLQPHMTLVVLARSEDVIKLRQGIEDGLIRRL
jgi:voltage-gated potassium channel